MKDYINKKIKYATLTQLNVLVVSHDEDDVWSDVSAVSLDATPEPLSSGGGESPAAWSPIQTQQSQPGQPLNQHGVQCNRPHDGLVGGLMGRWKGVEKQSGHCLTALQLSQPWGTKRRKEEKSY